MSHSFGKESRMARIRRGEPISLLGLTFYPIMMSHYEDFISCKDAIILRLGTLPVKYIAKDYFSAIFAFEMDQIAATQKSVGLFSKVLHFLELSLRIGEEGHRLGDSILYAERNGEIVIEHISVTQDGKQIDITPIQISTQIRPLLASLNGLELPDESENIDLVIANEQKKAFYARNQKKLKHDISDLISSVAYQSRCSERELISWTVREFESRRAAIERDKRYMLYGQAEMGGMVTFKNGNPAPSWCFDVLDDSLGTQSLESLNFGDVKQK